jgi:ubiquinone/menaquinone biosynthesis C-methylase UbiE
MPFQDGEFDAVWSIWVLEHIPNPEAALNEIRRVVKTGGYLYLQPAWACVPWAADGYDARPYRDFGMAGKLIKASIMIRRTQIFQLSYTLPARGSVVCSRTNAAALQETYSELP